MSLIHDAPSHQAAITRFMAESGDWVTRVQECNMNRAIVRLLRALRPIVVIELRG